MLEKIVYTIRDQSAIFQFTILSSLAGAREYIYHVLLVEKSGTFITYTYCNFNLVVGRKILWYFKLKILRGL
jgi:hypothetical protein